MRMPAWVAAAAVALFFMGVGAAGREAATGNPALHRGVVENLYVKRTGDRDEFYVVLRPASGEPAVFRIADSVWNLRFDSADLFARLRVGDAVTLRTVGYRSHYLSWYPNVLEVTRD